MFGRVKAKEPTLQTETMKFQEISYENPLDIFSQLNESYNYVYLLESIAGPQKLAEFSFIGIDPQQVVSIKNGRTEIAEESSRTVIETTDPLEAIRKAIEAYRIPHDRFRFLGGAVG